MEKPLVDTSPIEGKLMHKLIAKKWTRDGKVTIELNNYTGHEGELSVYEISADNAADAVPKADFVSEMDGQFTKVWKVNVPPQADMACHVCRKGRGFTRNPRDRGQ